MISIHKLSSRDQEALTDEFPQEDENYFETYYIEHLREIRLMFVALLSREDGTRQPLGYVSLLWEAPSTALWQRSIPEIVDLFVAQDFRKQGIASRLIQACELAAKEKKYTKLGLSVGKQESFAPARALYEKLGYRLLSQSKEAFVLVKDLG